MPPLESPTAYAGWTFVGPGGAPTDTLTQGGAPLYHPATDVVPFLLRLEALRGTPLEALPPVELPGAVTRGPVPPVAPRLRPGREAPAGAFAALAWAYWPELMTPAEAARFRATLRRRRLTADDANGYRWWVYDGPGPVEAAFTAHDFRGAPVPVYEVTRRPLADVAEALTAPAYLASLFAL